MTRDNPTIFEHEDAEGDRLNVDAGSVGVVFETITWSDDACAHVDAKVAVRYDNLPKLIDALNEALKAAV